jgi:hypothetical protein
VMSRARGNLSPGGFTPGNRLPVRCGVKRIALR